MHTDRLVCDGGMTTHAPETARTRLLDAAVRVIRGKGYHAPDDPFDRVMGYLDFRAALIRGSTAEGITAKSLALHTQVVLQGAFILAKAKDDPSIAGDSIKHLRRYFRLLFDAHKPRENTP